MYGSSRIFIDSIHHFFSFLPLFSFNFPSKQIWGFRNFYSWIEFFILYFFDLMLYISLSEKFFSFLKDVYFLKRYIKSKLFYILCFYLNLIIYIYGYIILEIIHFNFCFQVAMDICEKIGRKVFFFRYIIITFIINQDKVNICIENVESINFLFRK